MVLQKDIIIRVRNVSKKYGSGSSATIALADVSLDIYKGELIAIIGPSGSGKTTLSHIIGGLTTPDRGSVVLKDGDLKKQSDRALAAYRNKKVGFVFQNFSLIPHYSVLENIVMPLVVEGTAPAERTMRAKRLLQMVGLEKRMDKRTDTLSGGEKQRASIARALINQPEIIIADEPTGSLDSRRGLEIMAILEKLAHDEDVAVLMVTHDLELAKRADRHIQLRDGKIVKETR